MHQILAYLWHVLSWYYLFKSDEKLWRHGRTMNFEMAWRINGQKGTNKWYSFQNNNIQKIFLSVIVYLIWINTYIRHFRHVTKTRIFKSLNLSKKADRNFCRTFVKNRFRHPKLYSDPWGMKSCWLARSRGHIGTFWQTKDWSSHVWESQPFRFWYVEFHRQRRLKSTKAGISS